jgi:pyrimidine operon attenuation protein/uracil phosphoribosyltransferase
LILKAVAIEAQQRSAVINHQVVHEGESIEGHQVVSIQLKGVWLARHGKKEFLTFSTNTAS